MIYVFIIRPLNEKNFLLSKRSETHVGAQYVKATKKMDVIEVGVIFSGWKEMLSISNDKLPPNLLRITVTSATLSGI